MVSHQRLGNSVHRAKTKSLHFMTVTNRQPSTRATNGLFGACTRVRIILTLLPSGLDAAAAGIISHGVFEYSVRHAEINAWLSGLFCRRLSPPSPNEAPALEQRWMSGSGREGDTLQKVVVFIAVSLAIDDGFA